MSKLIMREGAHENPYEIRTVSFHNFKSQNFKLSVSNPKSKYVACLSVVSNFKLPGSRPQKQI